jgi:hypothetical protein
LVISERPSTSRPETFGNQRIMKIAFYPIKPNFPAMAMGLSEGPGGGK